MTGGERGRPQPPEPGVFARQHAARMRAQTAHARQRLAAVSGFDGLFAGVRTTPAAVVIDRLLTSARSDAAAPGPDGDQAAGGGGS